MPNPFFKFKQFTIFQDQCAMKVCTDSCLFGSVLPYKNRQNVLDIGTGTGLLSLMAAQLNTTATITAIEMDTAAVQQAKENVALSPFHDQITIIQIDFNVYPLHQKYDLIICNPPFYEKDLKSTNNKKNIAHHSAALTLNTILEKSTFLLNPNGLLYLMIPFSRKEEFESLLSNSVLKINDKIAFHQTTAHDCFRMVYGLGLTTGINRERTIFIKKENQYTDDFITCLKDFYIGF